MTTIRSEMSPTVTTALNDGGLLLASASQPSADPARTPNAVTSLRSDQAIVIPKTLARTPAGFGVRVDLLDTSQKKFYDRLTADKFTPAQINEIVTVIVRGGVDGLAGKYSRLSVDNLACLSHIVNDLPFETAPHDAAHMLLGNRTKMGYGVSEYAENVGNALGNNFLGRPQGLYEGFRVGRNELGGLTVAAVVGTREQVAKVFNSTENGSRVIDTNFRKTFLANSENRVWLAADKAMASPNLPFEARFALFYRELEGSGQVPVKGNPALTADLKKAYARLEDSVAGQTPSELRSKIFTHGANLIAQVVAHHATEVFKSIPDAKRFEFFADFIAMVVAMHNQAPNQITLPNATTDSKLFKTEWTDINTTSVDKATGTKPLAAPGFLRDFLDIRNQVRKHLGVPAAPVAVPRPTTQASTTPNKKPNGTETPGTNPGTTTTAAADKRPGTTTTTTTTTTRPKTDKGGYVQRPDAPKPPEIEKPLTFPLTPPKKAGPLHPPSRKPDADPRSGLFTSPKPKPGKPRHTGNTAPRPKLDPNPPRFPDISNVPDERLPNKLPNPGGTKAAPAPKVAQRIAPASPEYTWSPSPVKKVPKRAAVAAAASPQQGVATLQGQVKSLRSELDKLPKNAAPTLAQAQKVMAQMKAEMKAFVAGAAEVIKSLPSHLQGLAATQLSQLQAAWDRWSPGALKNLESFGKGAGEALGWAVGVLGGLGAAMETLQKIGG